VLPTSPGARIARCEQLLKDGADILDIGAVESARRSLWAPRPLERVWPVLAAAVGLGARSRPTRPGLRPRRADLGVDIVNDIAVAHAGALGRCRTNCGGPDARGTPRRCKAKPD
jgi:dihydropteroate synthase